MISLILGGIRSGKSRWAEQQFVDHIKPKPVYIATALASDQEMAQRIAHHQQTRQSRFDTHEFDFENENLGEVLERYVGQGRHILLECMSTWLGWWLCRSASPEQQIIDIQQQSTVLLECLERLDGEIVIVSNEVGLGLVSDNAMARLFADELGRLNQALAAKADRVVFISAGLPLILKEPQS